MFTIMVNGVEVRCESAADAVQLIKALDTPPAPPRAAAPAPRPAPAALPALRIAKKQPAADGRTGRPPAWTPDELAAVHARLRAGERIEVLSAEKGRGASALYAAFQRAGLSIKFARPAAAADPVPVRRLARGESGIRDEKGAQLKRS